MNERLFGRSAILIVNAGPEAKKFSGITPPAVTNVSFKNNEASIQRPEGLEEVFRIGFNVELTSEANANTAAVSIYNMNETNRSFFEKKDLKVILMAGYGPKPSIVFKGDVVGEKTSSKKSGQDIITTIESGDGRFTLKNTVLNKTFAPGISLESVIKDIQKSMGLPGDLKDIKSETFNQGLSISGSPREALDKLTEKQNLEWSIQGGVLQIKKKGGAISGEVVIVSPDTGLIDIPVKTNEGVEFQTLLNPVLVPGRSVKIESKFLKGTQSFIVRKVQHQGDNFTGVWTSFVEAIKP